MLKSSLQKICSPLYVATVYMRVPSLQLISGQYVFPHHDGSPKVEVEIIGIPVDLSKISSLAVSRNSVNPIWNEAYTFQVSSPLHDMIHF